MPLATDRGKWENFWQILIAKYSLQILTTPNSERTVSSNPGVINILLFFKGCWFFFHNGNFTSEVVRLLVFIFYKKLDKISSPGRKTFLSQFHSSQIWTNNSSNLPMESSSLLWGVRRVRRKMKFWCPGSQIIVAHLGIETSCKGGRHFPAN